MLMRRLTNNLHKRLGLYCIIWAALQIAFAYAFGGNRSVAYPIAVGCAVVTAGSWLVLPIVGRKFAMTTVSGRYYGLLRSLVLPSFFMAFIFPMIFYWFNGDKFHLGVTVLLGISAACSIVLAYRVYGDSMYAFMEGGSKQG